ncbi:MAG: PLP-dependent aminotransferase family protein, partial [Acidobacteriota bacterium]
MPFSHLHLDRRSGLPLGRQLADLLRERIASGSLPPGTRLPASRELAERLGVHRGTIQKAYEALTAEGILKGHVGRGTFVDRGLKAPPGPAAASPGTVESRRTSEPPFAFQSREVEDPTWDRIGRWAAAPGIISLAGGLPDTRLFPTGPFRRCLDAVLDEEGAGLLQYGASRGYPPFLQFLAGHLKRRGLKVTPQDLLVVSGSQQGLDLIGRALIAPGDPVVVEDPTYSGALALFRILRARLLPVPLDEEGLDVDRLATLVARERPKLVYTIPTFHNPTGQTLSMSRRRRLLEICAAAAIPVVEDDSDGELRFEGVEVPPLAASAGAGRVIYMGTFSKLFFPGLRLGWVAAPPAVLKRLETLKRITDLHTAPLLQAAMARFAAGGFRDGLADAVLAKYRSRRDAMMEALAQHMPEGVRWT